MRESRYKTDWLVVPGVVLLLIVVAVGAYTGAYFWRGTYAITMFVGMGSTPPKIGRVVRQYATQWEATLFRPGAAVESWLTGRAVTVYSLSDFDFGGFQEEPYPVPEPFLDDSAP